jgi:hypothetical protein
LYRVGDWQTATAYINEVRVATSKKPLIQSLSTAVPQGYPQIFLFRKNFGPGLDKVVQTVELKNNLFSVAGVIQREFMWISARRRG